MLTGSDVRFIRKILEMSERELAKELGISQQFLNDIETNKKMFPDERKKILMEKFKLSPEIIKAIKEQEKKTKEIKRRLGGGQS
jgi:DNA-binding transcriptional regulator YiaG